jgi:hypothetical protein
VCAQFYLRAEVPLEKLLDLGYSYTTSEELDLVDLVCSYTSLGNNFLYRFENTSEEISGSVFELLSFNNG